MSDSRARGPSGPGRPRGHTARHAVRYLVVAGDGHVVGAVP
jgi:hypothetical protein